MTSRWHLGKHVPNQLEGRLSCELLVAILLEEILHQWIVVYPTFSGSLSTSQVVQDFFPQQYCTNHSLIQSQCTPLIILDMMVAILQSPHCSLAPYTAWQCASCLARNSCMGSWLKSREGSAHCTNDVKTSGLVNCLQNEISTRMVKNGTTDKLLFIVCVLTIM